MLRYHRREFERLVNHIAFRRLCLTALLLYWRILCYATLTNVTRDLAIPA